MISGRIEKFQYELDLAIKVTEKAVEELKKLKEENDRDRERFKSEIASLEEREKHLSQVFGVEGTK